MKKYILTLLISLPLYSTIIDGAAAIVQDQIITLYDVKEEAKLAHISKKDALNVLIRKKLEEAEIKKEELRLVMKRYMTR